MIRPELRAGIARHAEVLIWTAVALAGALLSLRGGWFFAVLGAGIAMVGASLGLGAVRRRPFRRAIASPGMVEIVEGAVRYFGATRMGGEIALRDLTEIRLLRLEGHAHWRLRSRDGQALLIPADAAGSEALADAFTALPGIDMGAVSGALAQMARQDHAMRTVWRRQP